MSVLEIVRLIGGEFEDLPGSTIEQWIEYEKPLISKEKFGDLYERALALLVCHDMKMANVGGEDALGEMTKIGQAAGRAGITSLSEGGSSVSFAQAGSAGSASVEEMYGKTIYGKQYLGLLRMVIVPITISQ